MTESRPPTLPTSDLPTTSSRWQTEWRRLLKLNEAQAVLGWGVVLMLAALLGTIYLIQASRVAETGRRIQVMQLGLAEQKRQNAALERQIAEAQSLERLQRRAQQLGFVLADPEDITYVVVPNYPATHSTPAAPLPVAKPAPVTHIEEALWLLWGQSFNDLIQGESFEQ